MYNADAIDKRDETLHPLGCTKIPGYNAAMSCMEKAMCWQMATRLGQKIVGDGARDASVTGKGLFSGCQCRCFMKLMFER